ncbi:egl [Bugula neritina]|uniref:Egl n=1 Tax=Bugula neritina TaxID=10212 RepID=A0A7J7JZ63_BUGNE|nr:egl [Bugula neritina]
MSQKPEVVSTIKRSQGVVSSLLLTEYSVAVVAIAFKSNQLTGEISLIGLQSPALRNPVVFDVYKNPKLYMEGQLHRIFQAEKLIKIVHDCRSFCAQLKKLYYITSHSMFDTQVAYTLQMEENNLPPRLISYENLHKNIVGLQIGTRFSYVKGLEKSDGNLWNKRPLPDELLWALTEELNSLHNSVYPLMFRSITEGNVEEFELRCGLAARGMSRTGTGRVQTRSGRVATSTTPLLTINAMQAELLPNTKPIT